MRLGLNFRLTKGTLPLDFRPVIISFFKRALQQYLGGSYLEHYYGIGRQKAFSFAVDLGSQAVFSQSGIEVAQAKVKITFTTSEEATGVIFMNALLGQKNLPFPLPQDNEMILEHIFLARETLVTGKQILISFLSPLCVRFHEYSGNKDHYRIFSDQDFEKVLKTVLHNQSASIANWAEDFKIIPVMPKKTVVKHHGQQFSCSLGTFILEGNLELLNLLYRQGMGSRHSAGFGCFKILQQGGS